MNSEPFYDPSRALLSITGTDAPRFLQGIVTQDVMHMAVGEMRFSCLLSAQGKWLFDFFIIRTDSGFLLDVSAQTKTRLLQGLNLYKLRADVHINSDDTMRLYYLPATGIAGMPDPRHPALPKRLWLAQDQPTPAEILPREVYDTIRMQYTIPEGGIDVTDKETAMDVSYDYLHAINFTKGCYIGQEVTARMHYKSIARKGFYTIILPDASHTESFDLPAPIFAGEKLVAEARSVANGRGIAFAKLDVVETARAAKTPFTLGDIHVELSIPDWQIKKFQIFTQSQAAS